MLIHKVIETILGIPVDYLDLSHTTHNMQFEL